MERGFLIATLCASMGLLFFKGAEGIQCYQCYMTPPIGKNFSTTSLCINFDHSSKFIVDCPHSTMCMKKDLRLPIANGETVSGVVRDCATQLDEYYNYVGGRWQPEYRVLEPYNEGCQGSDADSDLIASTSHCYCRNELCNSSPTTSHEGYTDIMGVILVFNLMKYINSIR